VFPLNVLFGPDNQTRHTYGFLAFDSPKKNAFKGMPSTLDNRTTPDEFRNYIWSATVFHLGAAMADILGMALKHRAEITHGEIQ